MTSSLSLLREPRSRPAGFPDCPGCQRLLGMCAGTVLLLCKPMMALSIRAIQPDVTTYGRDSSSLLLFCKADHHSSHSSPAGKANFNLCFVHRASRVAAGKSPKLTHTSLPGERAKYSRPTTCRYSSQARLLPDALCGRTKAPVRVVRSQAQYCQAPPAPRLCAPRGV